MSVRVMADGRPYTRTDCREVRARHRPAVAAEPRYPIVTRCLECGRECYSVVTSGGSWHWRHRPGTFWRAHA